MRLPSVRSKSSAAPPMNMATWPAFIISPKPRSEITDCWGIQPEVARSARNCAPCSASGVSIGDWVRSSVITSPPACQMNCWSGGQPGTALKPYWVTLPLSKPSAPRAAPLPSTVMLAQAALKSSHVQLLTSSAV